jgi:hypothetical protein
VRGGERESFAAKNVLAGCVAGYAAAYPARRFALTLPDEPLLLSGAAVLSFVLHERSDSLIILGIVVLSVGLGAAYIRPKADNFVDKEETLMALGAGGGFEITFKKQITVRIDARTWSFFNQNHTSNGQEYSAGLAIFF